MINNVILRSHLKEIILYIITMKQEISYEDYNKVEIKIGTVLSVSKNEKAIKPSLVV